MRIILYILLLPQIIISQELDELSLSILSQNYNDMKHGSIYLSSKGDTITERKEGQVYTRLDHYEDGSLKAKYKVKSIRILRQDTTIDESKGQVKYINTNELKDIPFGPVEEYHNPVLIPKSKFSSKRKAQIKDGKIIGTMKYYPRMEDILITIEYNDNGRIEGSYSEFYNDNGEFTKLKCTGQYGYIERKKFLFNPDTYNYKETSITELQKVGTWKYYTTYGELEAIQNFSWLSNAFSTDSESKSNIINWKLEPHQLDSATVNNDLKWYTIHGEYKLDSIHIELDFNTYDKSSIKQNINLTNTFLTNYSKAKNKYEKYLELDFQEKGWVYDFIVDYLNHKKYRTLEYDEVINLTSFKVESKEAFKNLKLERIGFFDKSFDPNLKYEEDVYIIFDYDIHDSDIFDKLVLRVSQNGEIVSLSIEG